jgi:peptidoglycan/LPS O-acetylase OafA/YrhL
MTLGQPQSTLPIRQEIRSITGLRAFAAVAVYLNHFGLPGFSPDWLSNISTNGGLGVPFFFVLSGFVLALAYEDRPLIIRQFFIDRVARIAPTYYVGLAFALFYFFATNNLQLDHIFWFHLFGLQAWFPTSDSGFAFNGPAWTISVELFLYATFPFLYHQLIKKDRFGGNWLAVSFLGISCSLIPFSIHLYFLGELNGLENQHIWTYALPFHYLGLFILGIAGYKARSYFLVKLPNRLIRGLICDLLIVAYALVFILINLKDPQHPLIAKAAQFWLLGIPTALIFVLLSVTPGSLISRFLGFQPVWFAGKISMVFYLLHVPTVWIATRLFPNSSYEQRFLAVVLLTVLVHVTIELPGNRLIKIALNRTK